VDTAASSDERATRADQLQYEASQGPCLDAIWEQDTVQIDEMITEERYPAWSRRVAEDTGIRSSLSLSLFTNKDSLGALNLYSPQPRSFEAETRGEGLAFAAHAAVALRSAQTEQHLRAAMATRNLIGQAQGILMERFKVTAEQAFAALSRVSQESNVKLRDVAQRLIGVDPLRWTP
jgi:GAF domain-containing protein